jgi:hypothetical protein
MKNAELIKSLLPQLTPQEEEWLREELKMAKPTPCERNGHAYRVIEKTAIGFLWKRQTAHRMVCSKCGGVIVRLT